MNSRCVAVLIWAAGAVGLAQPPSLLIAPRTLSFTVAENGNPPPPQIITVSTPGTTTVEFGVTVDSGTPGSAAPSWVSVPTRRATSPARIFISVDQSGLSRGSQEPARILITSPNGQALADP